MRAAVYRSNRDVRVEDVPEPRIGPGELLFRVEASGICGSDVAEWYRIRKAPIVLGHEVAGVVEAVGDGVSKWKPGGRVVAAHHIPCNPCRYCLAGHHSVCDTLRTTTFDPGGFCDRIRVPAINVDRGVFRLPDGLSFEEGTFVEPLACVVRAQRIAGVRPGASVLVLGSGVSGVLHVKLAAALGAGRILATDLNGWRLAAVRRFGAEAAIRADDDVPKRVREANEGRGADVVLVCSSAPAAMRQAFASVDRGGTILIFALPDPGTEIPMPVHDVWRDGVSVRCSYAGPPRESLEAIELIRSRRVVVTDLITHRLPLERAAEGFALVAAASESLKVILFPQT
jgi:L-iditol 2-dehydrogenase